jgi:holin-like protein
VRVTALPLPGPVVGMMLLFALLLLRAPLPQATGDTVDGLLKHLSLLFIPAGVGVVQHLDRLGSDGFRLIAVVILATVVTLATTALTFEWLARVLRLDQKAPEGGGGSEPKAGGGP